MLPPPAKTRCLLAVCAAHEINAVTGVLVNYFVPPGDSRKMARNLAAFSVAMIVLAINDGMI